jgi:hypothetical protein
VTRGQAGEHKAVQALAEGHRVLLAGLREGGVITKSVALQLARWIAAIPREFREQTEEILVTAARAGADLRAMAAICAEIRYRTAPPDPDGQGDRHLDRGVSLDTTIDGAGVVRGDLTPECTVASFLRRNLLGKGLNGRRYAETAQLPLGRAGSRRR